MLDLKINDTYFYNNDNKVILKALFTNEAGELMAAVSSSSTHQWQRDFILPAKSLRKNRTRKKNLKMFLELTNEGEVELHFLDFNQVVPEGQNYVEVNRMIEVTDNV